VRRNEGDYPKRDIGLPKKITDVCLEGEEPISVDMEPEAAQQVPKEDSAIMPVREPKKRCRDRNLSAGRHQKPKEATWEMCGSWRRLIVA
jgi:hypothetical protein